MKSHRFLPAAVSVGSGCAALIYEVVWFQLLELVIGSSAVSMAVLLFGTFMGSIGLPRAPGHHPLRVYALLELGIGIIGLAVRSRWWAAMPRLHLGGIRALGACCCADWWRACACLLMQALTSPSWPAGWKRRRAASRSRPRRGQHGRGRGRQPVGGLLPAARSRRPDGNPTSRWRSTWAWRRSPGW